MKKNKSKEIYVCVLSTNNYLEGVLLLKENLKALNSKHDLLCLINENIDAYSRSMLDYFDIKYMVLPSIDYDNMDDENPYWIYTFDKLNVFKLLDYDKIVYLDSDFLILKNLDHLFDMEPLAMPHDVPFHEERYCSCVMVIKPNLDDFNNLVELAKQRNQRGDRISDQDVINDYFKNINSLPAQYNSVRLIENYESDNFINLTNVISHCNGVSPLQKDPEDPVIVHYIGKVKPFMVEHDFIDRYKYLYYYYLDIVREKERKRILHNKDLISIIIPLYNKEKYIEKCIKSILDQIYTNFELIIVDDKSTDKSVKICEKYAKNDNRIKIIKCDENRGVSHARNVGIECANGAYICFVDADDTIEKEYLEVLHYKSEIYNATFTQCAINLNGKPKLRVKEYEILFLYPRAFFEFFYERVSSVVFDKLIRREVFDDGLLRFNEDYRKNEDLLFVIQLMERSSVVLGICDTLYNYTYQKTDSLTGTFDYEIDRNLITINNYLDRVTLNILENNDNQEEHTSFYLNRLNFMAYLFSNILESNTDNGLLMSDPEFLNLLEDVEPFCEYVRENYSSLSSKCDYVIELYNKIIEKINN